jgi:hypothetical protein
MGKSISVDQNKRGRGRPATGRDPAASARLPKEVLAKVDKWAAANKTSRSEAIRQLVELGLAGASPVPRDSPKATSEASEMGSRQIDQLTDPSATIEEKQTRKRRLLKGPGEFREMRVDLPQAETAAAPSSASKRTARTQEAPRKSTRPKRR